MKVGYFIFILLLSWFGARLYAEVNGPVTTGIAIVNSSGGIGTIPVSLSAKTGGNHGSEYSYVAYGGCSLVVLDHLAFLSATGDAVGDSRDYFGL